MRHPTYAVGLTIVLSGAVQLEAQVPAQAPSDRPTLAAYEILQGERLDLDGRLDEPWWEKAASVSVFVQREPVEGAAPSQATVVRLAYGAEGLVLGVRLFDANAGAIRAFQRERDASLQTDDSFAWILDTFKDGRSGYFFETNPAGVLGDGLISAAETGGVRRSWDGIWRVATSRDASGWALEALIPFSTLDFDPRLDSWGINFRRTIGRRDEVVLWAGHRRDEGLTSPVFAGEVTGVGRLGTEMGDFAEVEVDQRRVNLTRFPLFFPEKRGFFLEGSGTLSFAPTRGVTPYFSRRIGLVGGTPAPIRFAGRVAGRVAEGVEVGALHASTSPTADRPGEGFTVGRVRALFGELSSIGALYTGRRSGSTTVQAADDRHTVGVDLRFATRTFAGSDNAALDLFMVGHDQPALEARVGLVERTAFGATASYDNRPVEGTLTFSRLGASFDPAVGCTPRNGYRRIGAEVRGRFPLEETAWVRSVGVWLDWDFVTDLGTDAFSHDIFFSPVALRLETGDFLAIDVTRSIERLVRSFTLFGVTSIPPGRYAGTEWAVLLRSSARRRLTVESRAVRGDFWSGSRRGLDVEASARPAVGLELTASWSGNTIDLPTARLRTNLYEAGGSWQPSPRVSTRLIVQYDDVSREVGAFARLRWTPREGTDVFLVYGESCVNDVDRYLGLDRRLSLKLNHLWRL